MTKKIFNIIKNNILLNNNIFYIKNNKKILNILNILLKLNIIKFIIKKDKKLLIKLNLIKKKNLFLKFRFLSKKYNNKSMKLKNLKKINVKNKIFLISTNKGIMTLNDSIKKKISGLVIIYFYK